jgi:hypothetical protein
MNQNYKAVLLTILTLSVFTLTIIELTGVSSTALFNKFHIGGNGSSAESSTPAKSGEKIANPIDDRMQKAAGMPKTKMQFAETMHNFGKLKEGEKVKYSYKFKNTGENPLMIAKTDVSCGCTVTSYSLQPIAPGGDGEITVEFNTSGKSGYQQKNIIVHSNAQPEAVSIGFEADVK